MFAVRHSASIIDRYALSQVPLSVCMKHVHIQDLNTLGDEQLLAYSLKSPGAFELLVIRYHKQFLERALYIVKSRDDAEDVVQDTFIRVYRFAPRFDGAKGTFKSWAMTILMNVARTRYQKKAKERGRIAPLSSEHYESLPAHSEKEAAQAKDIIERAFTLVPHDVVRILKLAFVERMPYRDIAKQEHTTEGAVKIRIHRAKKLLNRIIGTID